MRPTQVKEIVHALSIHSKTSFQICVIQLEYIALVGWIPAKDIPKDY